MFKLFNMFRLFELFLICLNSLNCLNWFGWLWWLGWFGWFGWWKAICPYSPTPPEPPKLNPLLDHVAARLVKREWNSTSCGLQNGVCRKRKEKSWKTFDLKVNSSLTIHVIAPDHWFFSSNISINLRVGTCSCLTGCLGTNLIVLNFRHKGISRTVFCASNHSTLLTSSSDGDTYTTLTPPGYKTKVDVNYYTP